MKSLRVVVCAVVALLMGIPLAACMPNNSGEVQRLADVLRQQPGVSDVSFDYRNGFDSGEFMDMTIVMPDATPEQVAGAARKIGSKSWGFTSYEFHFGPAGQSDLRSIQVDHGLDPVLVQAQAQAVRQIISESGETTLQAGWFNDYATTQRLSLVSASPTPTLFGIALAANTGQTVSVSLNAGRDQLNNPKTPIFDYDGLVGSTTRDTVVEAIGAPSLPPIMVMFSDDAMTRYVVDIDSADADESLAQVASTIGDGKFLGWRLHGEPMRYPLDGDGARMPAHGYVLIGGCRKRHALDTRNPDLIELRDRMSARLETCPPLPEN